MPFQRTGWSPALRTNFQNSLLGDTCHGLLSLVTVILKAGNKALRNNNNDNPVIRNPALSVKIKSVAQGQQGGLAGKGAGHHTHTHTHSLINTQINKCNKKACL